ncbi:hypothetical protein [Altererythrobacter aquiaggeris]|uniref:hypothetical protein n=1 Tax=Aestuarierythrobacter aquiaggeris TaxID=1898396 RepID=UPI003019CD65
MRRFRHSAIGPLFAAAAATICLPSCVSAQSLSSQSPAPTYADLADLAQSAELVLRATVKKQVEVDEARAPGLRPNWVRLYVEAETTALITGSATVGESLKYLVDVPRNAKGKSPKLKKRDVLLFAKPVAGSTSQIRLSAPDGQLMWNENLDSRLRPILSELASPSARPAISGVRDALSIDGNLAGESETQIFLDAVEDGPVSISVIRRPGMAPTWGVSWSEIVDQAARPPASGTLAWYRLACFLPANLPGTANLSRNSESRARAIRDYAFVIEQLGQCPRNRV